MALRVLDTLLQLFFPARCIFCRDFLPNDTHAPCCPECWNRVRQIPPRRIPIAAGECYYALSYRDAVRRAILAFKFHGMPQYDKMLAEFLISTIAVLPDVNCISWVPVSLPRLQKRGYNQSRLLAEALGKATGIPVRPLLLKQRHNSRQSRLSQAQRMVNVKGVYAVLGSLPPNLRVALVDDIVTTGSTISEACRVLQDAGAAAVYCVALAH